MDVVPEQDDRLVKQKVDYVLVSAICVTALAISMATSLSRPCNRSDRLSDGPIRQCIVVHRRDVLTRLVHININ